jgi:predicted nucleic acid-binding protein
MNAFVLDTSVAIAWYLPEELSGAARRWQRRMLQSEVDFIVPSLHYWEFCNVLRTYVRRKEMEPELAKEIYELHLDAPLKHAEPERLAILRCALDFQATAYDAVYIELSTSLGAPLVTAERSTTPWVVKLGNLARPLDAKNLF